MTSLGTFHSEAGAIDLVAPAIPFVAAGAELTVAAAVLLDPVQLAHEPQRDPALSRAQAPIRSHQALLIFREFRHRRAIVDERAHCNVERFCDPFQHLETKRPAGGLVARQRRRLDPDFLGELLLSQTGSLTCIAHTSAYSLFEGSHCRRGSASHVQAKRSTAELVNWNLPKRPTCTRLLDGQYFGGELACADVNTLPAAREAPSSFLTSGGVLR